MKTRIALLAILLTAIQGHAQVVLQDFSNVIGANTYFYGSWEAANDTGGTVNPAASFAQNTGSYTIDGTSVFDADSAYVEFFNTSAASIGSNGYLAVTATLLGTNAATSFQVTLVDTNSKTAFATFTTGSFSVGSSVTVISPITFTSGFLANSIDSLQISGAQPGGTARFSFTFDDLSAVATAVVPEPSTYAQMALGLGALGFIAYRRRKVA